MSVSEKSISSTVKGIINSDLSFQDSLQHDYCNITALARLIKPQIDQIRDRNTNIESIITAVKRSKNLYNASKLPTASILASSTISVKTDVAKLSAGKTQTILLASLTLVFDDAVLDTVKAIFFNYEILEIEEDLAAIMVHSPEEIIKTPGCAIAFYNQLAHRHINIEDTVSCYTDTIVLVKMSDVGKAFHALTDLISNSRKIPKKRR